MIFYYHQHPNGQNSVTEKRSFSPIPMNFEDCGFYSDRIFNAHNSESPFYVATFGYAQSWAGNNVYDRRVDRYTIHFVFDGKGTFNGQPVSAGQMFFAPQNQKYTIVNDEACPLVFSWIALSGTQLENQLRILRLTKDAAITVCKNCDAIQKIFLDTLYQSHQDVNLEMYLVAKMYEILSLSYVVSRSFAMPANQQSDIYYTNIISFINDNYSRDITIGDIARHVHISPTYVRQICRAKADSSPAKIISQKRLNVAKALLANDNSSIEEIAALVGFANIYSFSSFFKKNTGNSPTAYRKIMQEKKKLAADNQ